MTQLPRHWFPTPPLWLVLIVAALLAYRFTQWHKLDEPPLLETGSEVRVSRIIDGDTLELASGQRVRLIGVDTPESKHPHLPVEPFAQEAARFTSDFAEGQTARLELDRERLDRYGRILAYVYVENRMLNEELIRAGWSPAVTSFPYRSDMQRRFRAAEEEARAAKRGLWQAQ